MRLGVVDARVRAAARDGKNEEHCGTFREYEPRFPNAGRNINEEQNSLAMRQCAEAKFRSTGALESTE